MHITELSSTRRNSLAAAPPHRAVIAELQAERDDSFGDVGRVGAMLKARRRVLSDAKSQGTANELRLQLRLIEGGLA